MMALVASLIFIKIQEVNKIDKINRISKIDKIKSSKVNEKLCL